MDISLIKDPANPIHFKGPSVLEKHVDGPDMDFDTYMSRYRDMFEISIEGECPPTMSASTQDSSSQPVRVSTVPLLHTTIINGIIGILCEFIELLIERHDETTELLSGVDYELAILYWLLQPWVRTTLENVEVQVKTELSIEIMEQTREFHTQIDAFEEQVSVHFKDIKAPSLDVIRRQWTNYV